MQSNARDRDGIQTCTSTPARDCTYTWRRCQLAPITSAEQTQNSKDCASGHPTLCSRGRGAPRARSRYDRARPRCAVFGASLELRSPFLSSLSSAPSSLPRPLSSSLSSSSLLACCRRPPAARGCRCPLRSVCATRLDRASLSNRCCALANRSPPPPLILCASGRDPLRSASPRIRPPSSPYAIDRITLSKPGLRLAPVA